MLYKEAKPVLDLFHNCPIRNVTKGELKASSEKNVPLSSVSVVGNVPLVRFYETLYSTAIVKAKGENSIVEVEFAREGDKRLMTVWDCDNDSDVAVTFIDLPKGGLVHVKSEIPHAPYTAHLYRNTENAFLMVVDGETHLASKQKYDRMVVSTDTVLLKLNGRDVAVSHLNWADFFDNLDGGNEVAPEVFVSSNLRMLSTNELFENDALAFIDAYVHVGRDVSIATISSGKNTVQFLMEFDNPHPLLPSIVQVWPVLDSKTPIKLVHYGRKRTEGTVTKAELQLMLESSGYELSLKPLYKCDSVQLLDKETYQKEVTLDVVLTQTTTEAYLTTGVARFKAASLNDEVATLLLLQNQQMVVVVTPNGDCSYRNEVRPTISAGDAFAKHSQSQTLEWVTKAFGDYAKVSSVDYLDNTNVPVIYCRADSTGNEHFASRFAEALLTHEGETVALLIEREVNNRFIFRVKVGDVLVTAQVDKAQLDYLPLTHDGYELKDYCAAFSQEARLPVDYRMPNVTHYPQGLESFFQSDRKTYPIFGLTKGRIVSPPTYKTPPDKTWQFYMKKLSDGNLALDYWFNVNGNCNSYYAKVVKPQTTFCSWESALIVAV